MNLSFVVALLVYLTVELVMLIELLLIESVHCLVILYWVGSFVNVDLKIRKCLLFWSLIGS